MDFEYVLAELHAAVEGSIGVMLLASDGESVETYGSASVYDLKVLGAYQGIFLGKVRGLCTATGLGACQELAIHIGGQTVVTRPLPDGYYLTLILDGSAVLGQARHQLDRATDRLRQILF